MPRRDGPLAVLLILALVATATLTSVLRPKNPTALPTGLAVSANVESSALYCTGLSDTAGGVQGAVTFLNTGRAPRTVTVEIVSDTGHRASATLHLGGYTRTSLSPDQLVDGHSFGVSAVVNGGGVVADEVTATHSSVTPCSGAGVTSWYASGLDTSVGSSAVLSFYNPTATPAVINVTADTPSGFVAPAPFQGLPVAAHAQVELNLGGQIVNTRNVGVHVRVLRGALVIAGVENSKAVGSIDVGTETPASDAWLPEVTTADQALAEVSLANPGPDQIQVLIHVSLGTFKVPVQTITLAPYSGGDVTITPNSAIPAAGLAVVHVHSAKPFVATLATGTPAGVALTPAPTPGDLFLLADFATGYASATLTNTSTHEMSVSFPHTFQIKATGTSPAAGSLIGLRSGQASLAPGATVDLSGVYAMASSLSGVSVEIRSARAGLVVSATLATTPVGRTVVVPSDGG